jgi:hypothetical protein
MRRFARLEPHQKLGVTFRPRQRTLDQSAQAEAFILREGQNIQENLAVNERVADDAIAARDILAASFELRFDEGDNITLTPAPLSRWERGWG